MKIIIGFLLCLACFSIYAQNIESLRSQAIQRDADAQYQLGLRYLNGQGINQDKKQAFYWLELAAENGNLAAQQQITDMYLNGIGTSKSLNDAMFWMTSRAVAGQADAQIQLGDLYQKTKFFAYPIDYAKIWFRIAARHSPKGEKKYNALLEQAFNQQREKLISTNQKLEAKAAQQSEASTQHNGYAPLLSANLIPYLYLTCTILFSVIIFLLVMMVHHRMTSRQAETTETQKTESLQLQLKEKETVIQQQKRQLNVAFNELKKQRQNTENDKLSSACAMFGYPMDDVPELREIKLRYKQLCKIYHPDLNGSDSEMQRLNQALKLVVNYKKISGKS